MKIGQGAIGSHEKAPPEHRVDPLNPDVDTVSFGLRIVFHDGVNLSDGQRPTFLAPDLKCFPSQGFGQKALGGRGVALGRKKEVDGRPSGIHRAV